MSEHARSTYTNGELIERLYGPDAQFARHELIERSMSAARTFFDSLPVSTLADFRSLMAAKLSISLDFISDERDLTQVASSHQGKYTSDLLATLRTMFEVHRVDGVVLRLDAAKAGERKFLAAIDARGERGSSRAYFTSWHEIAHVLLDPTGAPHNATVAGRDPLESLVDEVAHGLGFFEPLFGPIVAEETSAPRPLSFSMMEQVRLRAEPEASLQATAIATVRLLERPCLLLNVGRGEGDDELVVTHVTHSRTGMGFPPIEVGTPVPSGSLVRRLFGTRQPDEECAMEDQGWWVQGASFSPGARIHVAAVSRAESVYVLVSPST